jgi:Uma2 family endonuclease
MNLVTIQPEDAMSSAARKTRYTPSQYLILERDAESRHEYYDGYITAMAGGTLNHSRIGGNIFRQLGNQLEDRECEVFASDARLCVSPTGLYTYPDVMVVCGKPLVQDIEGVQSLLNASMIVEVLSRTTESYDRGKKFAHYRRLESLNEYVLVSQDQVLVERYTRRGDDWVLSEFRELSDTLQLSSIDCAISLREIYAKVEFTDSSSE